jgi:hypothetical protein
LPQKSEVVAGGGEHGIAAVAVAAFQITPVRAVLGVGMTDGRLDRGAAFAGSVR